MEWLDLIFSAGGGGVLGLVASGFKQWMSWKDKKLALEHELQLIDKQIAQMQIEAQLAKEKRVLDLEIQESDNAAKNLRAAIEAEAAITGTSQWVTDLRGSLRPLITWFIDITTVALIAFDPTNVMLDKLTFLAGTVTGYWFGDRPRRSA